MQSLISDLIEHGSTVLVRLFNRQCGPDRLPGEPVDLNADEILSLYPPEVVFRPCLARKPLRWGPKLFQRGMEVQSFSVPSLYQPVSPFRRAYDSLVENQVIHGLRIRHPAASSAGPPICLIYCHGWSGRSYLPEMRQLFPAIVATSPRVEIYAVQLPHHMLRKPSQAPFSGSFYFDGVPIRNIESMRQGVSDASQLLSLLRDRYEDVVVAGTSLGGFTVSFLTTCDPRADGYVIVQAGADLTAACAGIPLAPCFQRRALRLGWSPDTVQRMYEPLRWSRYRPAVEGDRVVVVGGEYDRIVPVETVREMCATLGARHSIYYEGGHMSIGLFGRAIFEGVMKAVGELLREGRPGASTDRAAS